VVTVELPFPPVVRFPDYTPTLDTLNAFRYDCCAVPRQVLIVDSPRVTCVTSSPGVEPLVLDPDWRPDYLDSPVHRSSHPCRFPLVVGELIARSEFCITIR